MVSIIPGIEIAAPERTDTSSGSAASPKRLPVLRSSDAMLFVRGTVSTRRGSAIAGIACGLPIVGREGWETGWPITEAGVALLPQNEAQGFGPALLRILADKESARALAERSRIAYAQYFSWDVIAGQYLDAMSKARSK